MEPGDSVPPLTALHRPGASRRELEGLAWPASGTYAARWDPREGAEPQDHGDIGEDARGVWCRQHPEVLLAGEPALARLVARYRRTGLTDITAEDDRTRSAWELAVLGIIAQTHHRAVHARTRRS